MKIRLCVLVVVMVVLISAAGRGAYGPVIYGTGDGSSTTNSINIDDQDAWETLAATTGDYGKCFKVSANIDFDGDSTVGVGTFTGTFDGNGYTFSNFILPANGTDNQIGLFRKLSGTGATIKNLVVYNASISATSAVSATKAQVAIICAEVTGNCADGDCADGCIIDNCDVYDSIITYVYTQNQYVNVGPIVGANHGMVKNCTVVGGTYSVSMTAAGAAPKLTLGGVVGYQTNGGTTGYNHYGYCQDCTSSATLTNASGTMADTADIGGITGASSGLRDNILRCHFTGSINYTSVKIVNAGGLIGSHRGVLDSCSATGSLTVDTTEDYSTVGGMIGYGAGVATISYCFSNMALALSDSDKTHDKVGGAIGYANVVTVTDCYARGSVLDLDNSIQTTLTFAAFGGFVAYTANGTALTRCWASLGPWAGAGTYRKGFGGEINATTTFADCFWDTGVAGHTTNDTNATESTTAEMKTQSTFTNFVFSPTEGYKWKMLSEYDADTATDIKSGYPMLEWEIYPYSGGAGTSSNPYRIKTTRDWEWAYHNISNRTSSQYYRLEVDCIVSPSLYNMIIKKDSGGGNQALYGSIYGN